MDGPERDLSAGWSGNARLPPGPVQLAAGLLSAAIIIAGLWFGRELLVPLSLAFLLGFLLDPLVVRLKRIGVPRTLAVVVVVVLALGVLTGAGLLLTSQVRALGAELPRYETNIRVKLWELREQISSPGVFSDAAKTLETVKNDVSAPPDATAAQRVQIEEASTPVSDALGWAAAVTGPLTEAGIALVFLVLVLLDRQDLRDRLLRLLGGNLHRTTDAMNEAGKRIGRYLRMQLLVNASYGVPMAVGLWFIGVPGAVLWGVVAALMRFVPFVGPLISAAFPLALAFAVDPGWDMVLWTAALVVVLELVSNNVVEPWLYGPSTGLSAISLIVAAIFWTLLWGPVGLVMSTPLTVCLLVIGRHLPGLQFLDVLLGSQPVLDAPTRFYQRLIAGDIEEVVDMAEEVSASGTVTEFYDQVAVPALRLASRDHDSVSRVEHRHRIASGMERVIAELREQQPGTTDADEPRVVCLGGKWQLDALAARMLAHSLTLAALPARELDVDWSSGAMPNELESLNASTICLSHFSADPQAQVRYLCRRLRRRWPDLKIVLALWNAPSELLEEAHYKALGADAVATSVEEVVLRVGRLEGADQLAAGPSVPAPVSEQDVERVRALRASGVLGEAMRQRFDRTAKRAADIFDMPVAKVILLDDEWQHVRGSNDAASTPLQSEPAQQQSMTGQVVASRHSLVVEDIARDPRFAGDPTLRAMELRSYVGAPLHDAQGQVYGALCMLDTRPRQFTRRELRLLEAMADELMEAVLTERDSGASSAPAPEPAPAGPPSATVGQMVPE